MTKRLKRKHLLRENANLARAVDTLGDQLVEEQRKRKAAEVSVANLEINLSKAEKELKDLHRQLSNAREAQEKLRQALYPGQFGYVYPGRQYGIGVTPNTYTINNEQSWPRLPVSGVYVSAHEAGGVTVGGFNTRFSGADDCGDWSCVSATCGYCGNEVIVKAGESVMLDDPRVCEHVKSYGPHS